MTKPSIIKKIKYIFIVFLIILSLILINLSLLNIDKVKLVKENGEINYIQLPHNEGSTNLKEYIYFFNIKHNFVKSKIVKIIPDDCLEYIKINDEYISLDKIDKQSLCDWTNGFSINIGNYLKKGINNIEIKIIDYGGRYGLNILNLQNNFITIILYLFLGIFIILLVYFILKDLKLNNIIIILIILGIAIRLYYLSYTDYNVRTYDVLEGGGHLDYIKYVANKYSLPEPDKGWEYHQPPLYYISTAIIYKILIIFKFQNINNILQLLSLFYFIGFIIFGVLIFKMIKLPEKIFYLTSALFIFWPSGIIHSIRIGNDILFYFLYSIGLFFILKWNFEDQKKDLLLAAIFSSLTIITKSTGIVLIGIIGVFLLIKFIKSKQKKEYFIKNIYVFLIFIIAFIINFSDNFYYFIKNKNQDWLTSNVLNSLNRRLFVNNKPINYIIFDIKTFVTVPYTNTWKDWGGRQYFWNFLFKSSLFAEYSFNKNINKILAIIISIIFLILLFLFILNLFFIKKKIFEYSNLALILSLIFSIIILMLFRIKIPASCHGDFRFILPILISFCPFVTNSISKFNEKKIVLLEYTGYSIITLFVVCSILFFLVY